MYWVIQKDVSSDRNGESLAKELLLRRQSFSFFSLSEIREMCFPGNFFVYGEHSLDRVEGVKSGIVSLKHIPYQNLIDGWGRLLLNNKPTIVSVEEAVFPEDHQYIFIKPERCTKSFSAGVMDKRYFNKWKKRVSMMDSEVIDEKTQVLICSKKKVDKEYRFWIVNNEVVTYSHYATKGKFVKNPEKVPLEAIDFVEICIKSYSPAKAYVIDVCLSEGRWKIVEINTINFSGLYYCSPGKLVEAILHLP